MQEKVLSIINEIRTAKNLDSVIVFEQDMRLRDDLGFTSFDLAELTVKIEDEFDIDIFEDGLVTTVGEILIKLNKL